MPPQVFRGALVELFGTSDEAMATVDDLLVVMEVPVADIWAEGIALADAEVYATRLKCPVEVRTSRQSILR